MTDILTGGGFSVGFPCLWISTSLVRSCYILATDGVSKGRGVAAMRTLTHIIIQHNRASLIRKDRTHKHLQRLSMVQTLKKVCTSFVAMMTIVSSVGVGALGFAGVASAAMAGDLIKASGPAVYYYAADGKRYVFPNEKTYFSWYNDFSMVKTISDTELAGIPIGGNVTVRPGTKLVKIQTDPKVYAVTKCGMLHWIESETIAKSLYGDAWAARVIDVPDAFFVNYTIGSSVSSAVHPDGQLVQYSGDSNWYVVWNGQKRKFASQSAFDANMLNPLNSVMTTITYPNGADVMGREADLADVVCGAGGPVVGGDLNVALASDTPAGATVPKNAASVPMAKYVLTAGSSAVTITGLTLHRVGVGATSDLIVYLYDQNGRRLTTSRQFNSTAHTATFSGVNLTIPAGGMQSVYVYADFQSPGSTGGQHSIELMDAASVIVSSQATIKGSFPVRGNVFTVGTTLSGRLDVTKGATPANPTVGSSDVEISNFKLTANTNDIRVNWLTLYQAGSIANTDLKDLKLYQGSTMVASADSTSSDGRIVLKFNPPYLIGNGTTKVFSLRAKVSGRADNTIKTYIEYPSDVNATDMVYNAGAAVCIADTATGGCTSTAQGSFDGDTNSTGDADDNAIIVTTQGGTLTNAFNGPPTQNVAKGQLAVPLYKFSLTAESNLEIRNVRFNIAKSAGTVCYVKGSAGTAYFRSIRIKDMDTGTTLMGPTEMTVGASAIDTGTITLSEAFYVDAGKTRNLAVVADLANSEDAAGEFYGGASDCGYKVTLQAFQSNDVRMVDNGQFLATSKIVPNTAVIGNQMNVRTSNLTVALAGSPSSGTVVKKQQNVPVAGLVLSAGAQSDVLITNLTLTCQAALATSGVAFGVSGALANCDERVTSLSLWDTKDTAATTDDVQIGLAKSPDTTTGAAQISNMNLTIPGGTSKNLVVKASLSSTASTTSPYDKIAVGIAAAADVQAQDKDSNTVTASLTSQVTANASGASPSVVQTILSTGTLTITADSHPVSTIVVAGKDTWVPFAQYKASAQFEDIMIDRVAILASSTAGLSADNSDFTAVAIASGGAVKGWDILSAGSTGTKDIDLSASMITVPKDGSVNFQLWAKLSNIQSSSSVSGATTGVHRSGHAPAMGLKSGLTTGEWDSNYSSSLNIRSTGAASGDRIYASTGASHGNAMVSRKTKLTFTKQAISGTLTNADQPLMKFQVSADAAGSGAVKQFAFTLSKPTAVSLANFRVAKGSSDMALGDYSVTCIDCGAAGADADIESGSIAAASTTAVTVVVAFTNEETIVGSGNIYTIRATPSFTGTGHSVTMNFSKAPVSATTVGATGYLARPESTGFALDTAAAADTSADISGNYTIWSDNSEVPHASDVSTSRDWILDVYLEDLSQGQTLSI